MVKKKKNNGFKRIFLGLLILLLILSPFLSQKVSLPSPNDNWFRLSDQDFFAWLDLTPKETEGLYFYCNQNELKDVKTTLIPMFPYDNPFFLVMIDSVYTKDPFYKDYLLPYLKNKKKEIFTYDDSWDKVFTEACKKADLLEDPCVLILIGSPDVKTQILGNGLIRYPFFYWTNNPDSISKDFAKKLVTASGGEIFSITDLQSLEKMDISIHAPIPYQRMQFMAKIPYSNQFYASNLTVKSTAKSYRFEINPTQRIINRIKTIYVFVFCLFFLSSSFLIFDLIQRSRKKWKKNKKKKDIKSMKKKFSIAWLEPLPKIFPSRRIDKSPLVIGSSVVCDYIIPEDASVSAKHCQMIESKCAFYLFDLQSRNGTFVNGQKIEQKQLFDQDKIEIGKTVLIFHKSSLQYTSDEKIL
jgi:hypothetical protein